MAVLILPKLKPEADVQPPDRVGEWCSFPTAAFESIAKSLDYPAPGEDRKINSVPTIWALPLTLEMPLLNPNHALHETAVGQWQGMLAAIALAKVRSFPIKAQEIDLRDFRNERFGTALWDLLPTQDNALYDLNNGDNAWHKIFIWTWKDKPVGMTSPSTIIAPAPHAKWENLPWWNADLGQLTRPHNYLNDEEKSLLAGWIELLIQAVNNHPPQTDRTVTNTILGLLRSFKGSLPTPAPESEVLDENEGAYFGVRLNIGALKGLNYPIKAKEVDAQSSSLRVITPTQQPAKPLLLIDSELPKLWDLPPQDIPIHRDRTLANFNIADLKSGKIGNWDDVICLEPSDFFLSELTFIDGENALPGGSLPASNQDLKFKGNKITPLLPLNSILLDYFTPTELVSKLRFHQDGNAEKVKVTLNLELSGNGTKPERHQLVKEYKLEEENAIDTIPVLEIWPHFNIPEWKEYYAFYRGELDENSFQVNFNKAIEPHEFEVQSFQYLITKLDRFPSHINCRRERQNIGLILLDAPRSTRLTENWTVGVDFGTSFTNIYINERGAGVRPLPLKSLHLQVTDSSDTDRRTMFEYFLPQDFLPVEKPLPIATILTTREARNTQNKKPIYDGRIYIPDVRSFDPSKGYIETNLKWQDIDLTKLFLGNLCLVISALAAKEGVNKIQWSVSYPSAFSRRDIRRYTKTCEEALDSLNGVTGIENLYPQQDYFRTESLAMAQYFADKEDCNLVQSTCIDLGGGSADISIWQNNNLLHQCSFQLAGRDLFSQFVELKPDLIPRLFGKNPAEWSNIPTDKFKTKIDVLLRNESQDWLRNKRHQFEEDQDFQGLIRLMAIGTCGLYYYVGIVLKALAAEGIYTESQATAVYMGGNGAQLLHWLDSRGRFDRNSEEINELFNRMVAIGSGLEEISDSTQLSQKPKDEAACGLVLSDTKLKGLDRRTRDNLIVGEFCLLNGRELLHTDRLEFEDEDEIDIVVPKLDRLVHFIDNFNASIRDLGIEEIKPLNTYRRTSGLDPQYKQELLSKTERELKSMLLRLRGKAEDIRFDPLFILALKALLKVLAKEWAGK